MGENVSIESLNPRLDRSGELVTEQQYFDYAADARELALTGRASEQWSAGTAAERRAFARSFANQSDVALDDNVAFGRMDMDDGDVYYVGKHPIFDEDKNLLVMNWQLPAAAAYNQASAREPHGLLRKRSFDTEKNRIRDFQDTVFKDLAQAVAELEEWRTPDDSLLAAMNEKRSGQMADIVRTIQSAQDKIVRLGKDRLLVVQGGPGTGKTAVALHRVSWLLFNYQDELQPEDVLVIGPNPTFTRYIRRVLPDLGDNDVVQQALPEMLAPGVEVRAVEDDNMAALKGSAVMADVIAYGLVDRIREPKGPVRIQQRSSGRFFELPLDTVKAQIRNFKSDVYLAGRARFKTALIELANAESMRLGPFMGTDLLDPKSLESVLNQMWPQLNPQQFIRELLGSKERLLRAAAGSDLRAADVELLYRPMAASISSEPWTVADLALIDEASEGLRGAPDLFGHIVVDEAQDLSEMELLAIRRRSRNGSMTVVGDIAQSTGPSAMDDWTRVEEMLASSLPADVVELEHGYRVPQEVFALAKPVLAVAAPHVTPPLITRMAGAQPQFSETTADGLADELAKIVVHHSGRGRFVGVIAVASLWPDIRAAFQAEDIQWSESTSGDLSNAINLVTPEASKGLEFDAVIVVDPRSIVDLPHGERLLYISLTRTTRRLDIVYPVGALPDLLSVIESGAAGDPASPVTSRADRRDSAKDVTEAPSSGPATVPVASLDPLTPLTGSTNLSPGGPALSPIPQAPARKPTDQISGGPEQDALGLGLAVHKVELSTFERQMAEMTAIMIADEMLSTVQPKLRLAVVAELARIISTENE